MKRISVLVFIGCGFFILSASWFIEAIVKDHDNNVLTLQYHIGKNVRGEARQDAEFFNENIKKAYLDNNKIEFVEIDKPGVGYIISYKSRKMILDGVYTDHDMLQIIEECLQ